MVQADPRASAALKSTTVPKMPATKPAPCVKVFTNSSCALSGPVSGNGSYSSAETVSVNHGRSVLREVLAGSI